MKKQNLLLLVVVAFPALLFAQNFKGLKTVENNATLWFNTINGKLSKLSDYEYGSYDLNISSPFYGQFLTNRFMVGGSTGIRLGGESIIGRVDTTQLEIERKSFDANIYVNPTVRFYLNNNSKVLYFIQADADFKFSVDRFKSKVINQDISMNGSEFKGDNLRVGFGLNKWIDTYNYWEAFLNYKVSPPNTEFELKVGLRNIMPHVLPKKSDIDTPQYLSKGRSIFRPILGVKYYKDLNDNPFLNFNASYFQLMFLNERIAVGGNLYGGASGYVGKDNVLKLLYNNRQDYYICFSPIARYYMPLTKRLYISPQVSFDISYRSSYQKNFSTQFVPQIGFDYFVNRSVAYSLSFGWQSSNTNNIVVNSTVQENRRELFTSINLGVTYFIDKIRL
jgi:hypothetical protein